MFSFVQLLYLLVNLFCICKRAGESLTIVVLLLPGHSILRIPSIIPIGTSFSTLVLEIARFFFILNSLLAPPPQPSSWRSPAFYLEFPIGTFFLTTLVDIPPAYISNTSNQDNRSLIENGHILHQRH